ncbi:MAG: type II toxin-antitoxin system RelE/ParE family toxin [Nitrospirae bacterium]|nr:type II toxin-antitoxin system RelE/ParE family toxin [Nitrospirota bacterium]
MAYKIVYKESVEKDLKGLSRDIKAKIIDNIENNLATDPQSKGKQLKGNWQGLLRYEIRPYRVIYSIFETEHTILILRIGHRKDVYRKR